MFSLKKQPAKRPTTRSSKKNTKKQNLTSRIANLSKKGQLILFMAVFAALGGGYMAYRSFAGTGTCADLSYQKGSTGTCVQHLQSLLDHYKFTPANSYVPSTNYWDGSYGNGTVEAMKQFQNSNDRCGNGCLKAHADGKYKPNIDKAHICYNATFQGKYGAINPTSHPFCKAQINYSDKGAPASSNTPVTAVANTPAAPAALTAMQRCQAYKKSNSSEVVNCLESVGTSAAAYSTTIAPNATVCAKFFGGKDGQVGDIEVDFEFRAFKVGLNTFDGYSVKNTRLNATNNTTKCAKNNQKGPYKRQLDIFIHRRAPGEVYALYSTYGATFR